MKHLAQVALLSVALVTGPFPLEGSPLLSKSKISKMRVELPARLRAPAPVVRRIERSPAAAPADPAPWTPKPKPRSPIVSPTPTGGPK